LKITDEIVHEQHLTTLMITHNMKDALKYGNRLIMMNNGRIIADYSEDEKKNLTIDDLLKKFEETADAVSDRIVLG
jgi:putative ABC transport system ATP-binding protein